MGRRRIIKNDLGKEFRCDSLSQQFSEPRSYEVAIDRLKSNLYRHNKKKDNKARSTMFVCYEDAPVKIGNEYKGGNNTTTKFIVPIPYQLEAEGVREGTINDENGLPFYVKKFDILFGISEEKKLWIISKRLKQDEDEDENEEN
jgi:hypothetical protein